jgi:hypothetical protein
LKGVAAGSNVSIKTDVQEDTLGDSRVQNSAANLGPDQGLFPQPRRKMNKIRVLSSPAVAAHISALSKPLASSQLSHPLPASSKLSTCRFVDL